VEEVFGNGTSSNDTTDTEGTSGNETTAVNTTTEGTSGNGTNINGTTAMNGTTEGTSGNTTISVNGTTETISGGNSTSTPSTTEAINPANETLYLREGDVFLKGLFFGTVDDLLLIEVNNSFEDLGSREDLYVYLQIADIKTTPKLYSKGRYVVGSYSTYITMVKGNMLSITWVDGCTGQCDNSSDQCISNLCALVKDDCNNPPNTVQAVCNMKAYIAFVGTDLTNLPLVSAGSLPNNFQKMSFGIIYDQSAGMSTQQLVL